VVVGIQRFVAWVEECNLVAYQVAEAVRGTLAWLQVEQEQHESADEGSHSAGACKVQQDHQQLEHEHGGNEQLHSVEAGKQQQMYVMDTSVRHMVGVEDNTGWVVDSSHIPLAVTAEHEHDVAWDTIQLVVDAANRLVADRRKRRLVDIVVACRTQPILLVGTMQQQHNLVATCRRQDALDRDPVMKMKKMMLHSPYHSYRFFDFVLHLSLSVVDG